MFHFPALIWKWLCLWHQMYHLVPQVAFLGNVLLCFETPKVVDPIQPVSHWVSLISITTAVHSDLLPVCSLPWDAALLLLNTKCYYPQLLFHHKEPFLLHLAANQKEWLISRYCKTELELTVSFIWWNESSWSFPQVNFLPSSLKFISAWRCMNYQ